MKITLAMVMSVDGKITRGNESQISNWTSIGDQAHFAELKARHNLIIMGTNTYLAAQDQMILVPSKLRVVVSHHPERYAYRSVARQLEFSSLTPQSLVEQLTNRGYKEALLVGGAQINASFLAANLVDEIQVTLEPKLFGLGKPLVEKLMNSVQLELLNYQLLNQTGTLLLTYKIINKANR